MIISTALDLARTYPISYIGGWKNRRLFRDAETYCSFIGPSRSGKSLTSSLLDAHPAMIIANDLGVLKYIYARFSQRQIYYLLLENSRSFARAEGISHGYSYKVPNQYQGTFRDLRVIGDDHGVGAILRLRERPWLLQRLREVVSVNTKFVQVARNPYDNISAIVMESKRLKLDLESSIEHFFFLCGAVADTKRQIESSELFELRYESLVESPRICLGNLCRFLGVEVSTDYLSDCASIVFGSPRKSRYDVQWGRELIDIVRERMEHFSFLHGYSYDN